MKRAAKVAAAGLVAVATLCWGCSRAELVAIAGPPDAGAGGRGGAGAGGASGKGGAGGAAGGAGGAHVSCPSTALPVGDVTRTVVVDGMSRTYLLHVPPAYNGRAAVPLLLDFHSIGVPFSYERTHSTFPAVTDAEGVVMAFPQGASGPLGAAWNVGPCCVADVDDVKFSLAVVADIESVACIDTARVYATGFSMGGGMAYTLACEASAVFAAIAPSAFDMTEEALPDCKPKRGITVIAFRGTSDNIVRYAGGPSSLVQGMPVTFLGAQGTFQKWGELDQCAGTASASDANGCSRYSGCKDAADVILCTSSGGQDFADATFAWPILKAHSL